MLGIQYGNEDDENHTLAWALMSTVNRIVMSGLCWSGIRIRNKVGKGTQGPVLAFKGREEARENEFCRLRGQQG